MDRNRKFCNVKGNSLDTGQCHVVEINPALVNNMEVVVVNLKVETITTALAADPRATAIGPYTS